MAKLEKNSLLLWWLHVLVPFIVVPLVLTPTVHGFSMNNQGSIEPWSRIAEFSKEGPISCRDACQVIQLDSRDFDLQSPREWMEYLESSEGMSGAYTVIRCDFSTNKHWRIWGRDFHINRLCQSYRALQVHVNEEALDSAMNTTDEIIANLLNESFHILNGEISHSNNVYTIMLTILWQKGVGESSSPIVIRGHVFCSGRAAVAGDKQHLPEPTTATLALPFGKKVLPNRYSHYPEAKLSSWCRQRRPLEQEFKRNGEVLLTREVRGEIHILEGLTSNVFFVYSDNKLRTANKGVLEGYAKSLVLDCASRLGIECDPAPIRVQDASLWREIFLTSSVRLLIPVKQVLVPNEMGELHEVWSTNENDKFQTCNQLYRELLKEGA